MYLVHVLVPRALEILVEQEQYLRNVPNLTRMTAVAESGSAEIELEFPFNVDMTAALIQVNNALSQVSSYPNNVDQPRVVSAAFSTDAFLRFHVGTLPGNPNALDIQLMSDFIEDRVRPRLEGIEGVSEVGVNGGAQRQLLRDEQTEPGAANGDAECSAQRPPLSALQAAVLHSTAPSTRQGDRCAGSSTITAAVAPYA